MRVMQGAHSGASGIIQNIVGEKHALVTLEGKTGGGAELKILFSNMRKKEEEIEYTKNSGVALKDRSSMSYQAGDVLILDNYQKAGIVMQVFPDCLKVMLENNLVQTVEKTRVCKKIFYK